MLVGWFVGKGKGGGDLRGLGEVLLHGGFFGR